MWSFRMRLMLLVWPHSTQMNLSSPVCNYSWYWKLETSCHTYYKDFWSSIMTILHMTLQVVLVLSLLGTDFTQWSHYDHSSCGVSSFVSCALLTTFFAVIGNDVWWFSRWVFRLFGSVNISPHSPQYKIRWSVFLLIIRSLFPSNSLPHSWHWNSSFFREFQNFKMQIATSINVGGSWRILWSSVLSYITITTYQKNPKAASLRVVVNFAVCLRLPELRSVSKFGTETAVAQSIFALHKSMTYKKMPNGIGHCLICQIPM